MTPALPDAALNAGGYKATISASGCHIPQQLLASRHTDRYIGPMILYVVILFLSGGACLALAAIAWRRRTAEGATLLSLFLLSMGLTNLAYGMDTLTASLPLKLLWNHAQYLFGMLIPILVVLLSLNLTGQTHRIRPRLVIPLFLAYATIVLLNLTHSWHHLTYRSVWVDNLHGSYSLAKDRGPLYWLLPAYIYIALPWAALILWRRLLKTHGRYRIQLGLILLAILSPIIFNLPYTLRLMPDPHLNLTVLGHTVACLALAWGMFRHQLLNIIPYSRDNFFEQSTDALIVMDLQYRILDFNPAAALLLPAPSSQWIGQAISLLAQSASAWSGLLDSPSPPALILNERRYQVRMWPMARSGNRTIGYFACLSDSTEQHQSQEELRRMIASREEELRHATEEALHAAEEEARRIGLDIHDGLCQELIGLSRLAGNMARESSAADHGRGETLEEISTQATRLARMAREYSHDLTMHDFEVQTLPEALTILAHRMEQLFQLTIEINNSSELNFLRREQASSLYRIIREAVSNAIRHAEARRIWIDIIQQDESLMISVSNDGKPLPPEKEIVPGLGLRQIHMRARLLGAEAKLIPGPQKCAILNVVMPLAL